MFVRPLLIGTSVASYFKHLFLDSHLMCANFFLTAPYKMGIHRFLGKVKAGDGMEAIERESNHLGVRNVAQGARLGIKIASQLLSGKYGDTAVKARQLLDSAGGAAGKAKKVGNELESAQRTVMGDTPYRGRHLPARKLAVGGEDLEHTCCGRCGHV